MDSYVLQLDSQRIKLVAKLKAVFDRFDRDGRGTIDADELSQLLVYINKATDLSPVSV